MDDREIPDEATPSRVEDAVRRWVEAQRADEATRSREQADYWNELPAAERTARWRALLIAGGRAWRANPNRARLQAERDAELDVVMRALQERLR